MCFRKARWQSGGYGAELDYLVQDRVSSCVEGEDRGDSRIGIYVATGLTPAWDFHWTQDLSKKLIFGLSGPLFKEVQAFQG